jgi:LPS sulfotransferase NodH
MKPMTEALRKYFNRPQMAEWFEYLYNEMKKREQKIQHSETQRPPG